MTHSALKADGFHFLVIAPVVSRTAVLGTLFVMSGGPFKFTQQDIDLLSSTGAQIGVAIENARLFAAEQRRAEQFRLINQAGRELTLIRDVTELLKQVTRMIQEAFGYYHVGIGLIEGVETSLGELVRQLAEAATGRLGVPVRVAVDHDRPLPPDMHVALYRIAQEALNNMVKHSRASQAEVSLRTTTDLLDGGRVVELQIQDDGRGFDPAGVSADHLGLGIMRERAEANGARLQIESEIGQGTRISVAWRETLAEAGPST